MSREDLHFRLRLPADLKAEIEAAAEANARSITAEIVARLRGSALPSRDEIATQALAGMLSNGFRPTEAMLAEKSSYDYETPAVYEASCPDNSYVAVAYRLADAMLAERAKGGA